MSKNNPATSANSANLSRRSFLFGALAVSASLAGLGTLSGCGSDAADSSNAEGASESAEGSGEKQVIKISAIAREEPEITWLKGYLADTYDIEPVIFSDNASVNESLVDGSVDLNYFQNANYLENTYNAANGTDLQPYGEGIFYMPYTITSRKYKSLDEIEDGASVLIASQASATSTELRVLEKAGLITVDPDVPLATVYDMTDNPKNLDFVLIEARSRVGAFDDADLMVAESMNVVNMHRDDVKLEDALYIEDCSDRNKYEKDLVITVRKETKDENPQCPGHRRRVALPGLQGLAAGDLRRRQDRGVLGSACPLYRPPVFSFPENPWLASCSSQLASRDPRSEPCDPRSEPCDF